ncbi:MAG: AAA family ATPase, partial [Promethearchaeota archaeon]
MFQDIKFNIKNFGPIFSANIKLNDLTLFIGQNNTGKSYTAMLIHIIFNVINTIEKRLFIKIKEIIGNDFVRISLLRERKGILFGIDFNEDLRNKIQRYFEELIKDDKKEGKIEFPKELIELIYKNIKSGILQFLQEEFSDEIKRNFSSSLSDIIKNNKNFFQIEIIVGNEIKILFECENNTLIIKKFDILIPKVFILKKSTSRRINFSLKIEKGNNVIKKKLISILNRFNEKIIKFHSLDFANELLEIFFDDFIYHFKDLIRYNSLYLPATRSGLLQGQKALSASFMHLSSLAGIKPIQIPTLSGIITDFIVKITTMEREKKRYYKLAEYLEQEIINGRIDIQNGNAPLREIVYILSDNNKNLELHKSSSMVSELAPIILYFKYIVNDNNIIIIEEPEAHLHPDAQRAFARFIIKLIRAGVKLLITTHSDYLLLQLNN